MAMVHQANGEDIGPVADSLARAFDDDPVMAWLFGEDRDRRLGRLRRFFRQEGRRHVGHDGVFTNDGRQGAAMWAPPDEWRVGFLDIVRMVPVMLPALGPRLRRALGGLDKMERAHPRAPHWYLAFLGTDPAHQGRGVGRSLVEPVLERCDATGLGAYLESSKPQNVPYYERFGFAATGQIDLPGGPPLWPMWRDPR